MQMPPVGHYMNRTAIAIGAHERMARAHSLMREHRCHHLPVLEDGDLVGLLTDRGTGFCADDISVAEAMLPPFVVMEGAPLDTVVDAMMERQRDCAVVLGPSGIAGVFTTSDALHALGEVLRRAGA